MFIYYFISCLKRVLQVYPGCPAAVRLGIGLCRYKLGQLDKARQAFDRVLQASRTWTLYRTLLVYSLLNASINSSVYHILYLQLDPDNVEALVALGIMDLQANDCKYRSVQKISDNAC